MGESIFYLDILQEEEMIKVLEGSVFSFSCSSLGGKPPGIVRQDISTTFMLKEPESQVEYFLKSI
jgi:hypothetical protein